MNTPPFDPNAGQYNQDPTQYGQGPGGYGQAPGDFGQAPGNYGQAPGQYGQAPGQYGQAPGQFGQGPPASGPGFAMPRMGNQQGRPLAAVARKRGMTQVIIGSLIFVAGLVVTITTYAHASSSATGGSYVVAYGPMIIGAITVVRGLLAVMRSNRLG